MKTNHRRNFVAKTHDQRYLGDQLIDRKLGVLSSGWEMVHHAPGRKGFIKAKRACKQAGHARVRRAVKKVINNELDGV